VAQTRLKSFLLQFLPEIQGLPDLQGQRAQMDRQGLQVLQVLPDRMDLQGLREAQVLQVRRQDSEHPPYLPALLLLLQVGRTRLKYLLLQFHRAIQAQQVLPDQQD